MTIWITSDHHFNHANVMTYCNRDFKNVDEMDEALIDAWNKHVKKDDLVYYLGDFTLGGKSDAERYFLRLNGAIRVLEYPWHHDKRWLQGQLYYSRKHEVVLDRAIVALEHELPDFDIPVILCHFPIEEWDRKHYGSIHLHGHSHGNAPKMKNRLDVGVDSAYKLTGEYRPLGLGESVIFARGD